jgi:hypothetical protein
MVIIKVPENVRELLMDAGWFPSRSIGVPMEIPQDHPAARLWDAFGGLHVGATGTGIAAPRADILFEWSDNDVSDIQSAWSELLGMRLIYAGWVHHGHSRLLIGTDGRCFNESDVSDDFWFVADDWEEAIQVILLGLRRDKPMIRPNQTSMWSYGDEIFPGDPRLYRY